MIAGVGGRLAIGQPPAQLTRGLPRLGLRLPLLLGLTDGGKRLTF